MKKSILSAAVPLCLVLQPSVVGAQTSPRVRITIAAIVEMPGIARLDGRSTIGPVIDRDEETVTFRGKGSNPITLPRPRRKVVGILKAADSEVATLVRTNGSTLVVPRSAITKVERANGRRSRGRAARLGFLIGAGGGAGIGYLHGVTCTPTHFLGCLMEPWSSTIGGVIVGGGVGALLGALSPPKYYWVAVPGDWLDSAVSSDAGPTPEAQVPMPDAQCPASGIEYWALSIEPFG